MMLSALVAFALTGDSGLESIHAEDAGPLGKRSAIERVDQDGRTEAKPPFEQTMRAVPVRASSPQKINSVIAAAEARGSEVVTLFKK